MILKSIPQLSGVTLPAVITWVNKLVQCLTLFNNQDLGEQVFFSGMIVAWDQLTPQPGWYFMSGQLLQISEDQGLWKVYGNGYSIGGDPAGTFRLPNRSGTPPYAGSAWMIKR